jgi:oligoribonuclease
MTERNLDRIVWIDCEMTGLDLSRDALVEVAVIVTDSELNELGEGESWVINPADPTALEQMDPYVHNMHTSSGLLSEIPGGIALAAAEAEVLAYIRRYVPEPLKAPLAGSSVYVDRGYLARDLPKVDSYLHYRLVDVSSVKELVRRWYPKVYYASPKKVGNHRALGDIRESIAELRYYRELVFVAPPGPLTHAARAAAANHALQQQPGGSGT